MVGPPSSWSSRDQEEWLLAGSIRRSSARWPFCLGCIPGVIVTEQPEDQRRLTRISSQVALAITLQASRSLGISPWRPHFAQPKSSLFRRLPSGGDMLFTTALVLLIVWLLGVLGLYSAGKLVHVLLLVGLMLLLLAVAKALDVAAGRSRDSRSHK
jgi:hypothetical protein